MAATPHNRRNHERRGGESPETLVREARRLLEACGVEKSVSWISRIVREYGGLRLSGYPFGAFLLHKIRLTTEQRIAALAHSDLAYVLDYPDPVGETAVRNVTRSRS